MRAYIPLFSCVMVLLLVTATHPRGVDGFSSLRASSGWSTICERKQNYDTLRATAFCSVPRSVVQRRKERRSSAKSQLNMFMGSDGGILGVGTPELITIVLVGYFVLGPTELYKLTKEIGKFITNIRTLGTEATSNFQGAMENQLQLDEIRKAQAELTDAFSFRRSINYEEGDDYFGERRGTSAGNVGASDAASAEGAVEASSTKKKKRRRVKKRKKELMEGQPIEDLDMGGEEFKPVSTASVSSELSSTVQEGEETTFSSQSSMAEEVLRQQESLMVDMNDANLTSTTPMENFSQEEAQRRFQSQLDSSWNEQILSKEEELSPLATIMKKLALLEEERQSTVERLEEEFRLKEELEEKYFQRKRDILEQAAADIQASAYINPSKGEVSSIEHKGEYDQENSNSKQQQKAKQKG